MYGIEAIESIIMNSQLKKKALVKSLTKNFGITSSVPSMLWEYADVHIYTVMYVH